MWQPMRSAFDDRSQDIRLKIIGIYTLLIAANIAAWIWALIAFRQYPLLLGTALLAYTFGLRHAVDADHISAIDNVTRKLMQEGKRPVTVGFFFSLGHSTVVFVGSAAGVPWYAILCLPVLFAAGMSLLDSFDGSFINFACGWAPRTPPDETRRARIVGLPGPRHLSPVN